MSPQEQMRVLLAMLLCGAVLGAIYDVLWLLRCIFSGGRVMLAATDLLFGVLCALGVILAALRLQVDALRWYTLLGTLCGIGLYRACAGVLLHAAFYQAEGLLKKLSKKDGK